MSTTSMRFFMIACLLTFFNILKEYVFPWWSSNEKKTAWSGLIVLLGLSLLSVYIAVLFNNWNRDFYNTIEKKDLNRFLYQVIIFIPLLGILILDFCSRNWLTAWLSFRWRCWFTRKLQKKWLSHKNFYKISLHSKEIDNPDQRISQDIKDFCYTCIGVALSFFREGVNFITFAIILWNLSRAFEFSISNHKLYFPGLLVWAAIAYSLIGTFFTFKIGSPIIALDRAQEKREADFRYRLMRIFERREEIATFAGEEVEQQHLQESFSKLAANYYQVLKQQIHINLFENFYTKATMFVPLFLVGPLYFNGFITMGVLMQSQGMFLSLNGSLSSIIRQFQVIASGVASLQRLVAFNVMMHDKEKRSFRLSKKHDTLYIPSLTIRTPDQKKIWISPEVILKEGDRKILMAPSGIGKSSFLRVLAGIHPYIDSELMPLDQNAMIVPQRPYMPLGTLRQCLLYPSLNTINEQQLIPLMIATGLEHLLPLLDEVHDYHHRLSLGEQQRINFVRVLLHHPKWLFMDEPIAHLHQESSEVLVGLLIEHLPQSGIFMVSHQEISQFEKISLHQTRSNKIVV